MIGEGRGIPVAAWMGNCEVYGGGLASVDKVDICVTLSYPTGLDIRRTGLLHCIESGGLLVGGYL